MIDVNALVQSRISSAMSAHQTRLDNIAQKTGLSFSAYYMRSVKASSDAVPAGAETEEAARPESRQSGVSAGVRASDYDGLIADASSRYGVDELLIRAVIYSESGFRSDVTSGAGAMGLMQLMPYTAEALGVADPYDPAQNIDGGVRLLSSLLDRFGGDARLAVAAYNCGAGGVITRKITDLTDDEQRSRLPAETQQYLARIESYLAALGASSALSAGTGTV